MEILSYSIRCIVVCLIAWLGVRIIGKKSISQITSYDLALLGVLANIISEPLVYKVTSKALVGSLIVACMAVLIGWISLQKHFYNFDSQPNIVVFNGKVIKNALKQNRMNLPFFLSMLRTSGYANVSDVEFAIIEPSGNLSVIPKSQNRPVTPEDLKIDTQYEGLALPLVIDGEIQYNNLKYAKLDTKWLKQEIQKAGATSTEEIFLAELDTQGKLYVDFYKDDQQEQPGIY